MKSKLADWINKIANRLGYRLVKLDHQDSIRRQIVHDPALSFMVDREHREQLISELVAIAQPFLNEKGRFLSKDHSLEREVTSFFDIYHTRPFLNNTGGSGFHNAFWLFVLARLMRPHLIIESGIWKGHTTWLFRQACPNADIHGFDTTLKNLEHREENIIYHQSDWTQHEFEEINPEKSLCFFDCHTNHAQRIIEAYERGFRHLLFDDNPPNYKLYTYKRPGFPTVDMLVNTRPNQNQKISWYWQGQLKEYVVDSRQATQAKNLINCYVVLPDVGGPTRYGGFSFLSYVELTSKKMR